MAVTFKEVAELAGVSTQTVSRVTNGAESVSATTRNRVLKAIDQLGYVPNKAAQALKANTKIIGVVSLSMAFHGAAMIANGIRLRAHELGYATAISAVDNVCENQIEDAIRELLGQKVESIIVITPVSTEFAIRLTEKYAKFQLLFIDVPPHSPVHHVCSANDQGARLGAKHLLELGRSRFVLISGPEESSSSLVRLDAWKEEIKAANAKISAQKKGDWLTPSGYLAMTSVLTQTRDFDAVLVANDQMALGVMRALHEQGINVPKDVSVVGFDGTEDSEFFQPPLTTIKQNFTEHGHIAVDQLLDMKEGSDVLELILDVSLIDRESSSRVDASVSDTEQVKQLLDQAMRLLN
ncbi:LacI family DNA-binding transcriptional regulator [Vibrio agarivorans]|uniref:LacI family DNA-binding transcriptional regulator n=1 Tax=Vibrio agarivorans TaxID=153622 RepID=UPI002232C815|nr:LacI family DNA-binding transcriptional regulator [Vibrio agarivorans]